MFFIVQCIRTKDQCCNLYKKIILQCISHYSLRAISDLQYIRQKCYSTKRLWRGLNRVETVVTTETILVLLTYSGEEESQVDHADLDSGSRLTAGC